MEKVLDHFGSVEKVAEFFGITVQAVYQWSDASIPRERELELLLRLPNAFNSDEVVGLSRHHPHPQPEGAG